jgi:hypothetical protein
VIDDPMDALLAPLDPSGTEAPPAPGSARYASILERAMSDTDTLTPILLTGRPGRPHRWRRYVAAVAATLVAVVASAALLGRGADDPDPISVVSSAAERTGDVTGLRASFEEETDYAVTTGMIEVNGNGYRLEVSATSKEDGHVERDITVVIGRHAWQKLPDGSTHTTLARRGGMEPFGSSSQAVVAAALSGSDVAVVGHETVRGEPTTHFRVTLDDAARSALEDLEPGIVGWFGLNVPVVVRTVDVWVGGDLIRRIQVQTDYSSTTTDYFDFGADIDIERLDWAS